MNKIVMWIVSFGAALIVSVLIHFLGKAINYNIDFLQGWFSCMAYAITWVYLILKYDNK